MLNQVAGSSLPTMLPPLLYACASLSRRAFALIDACRCCLTFSQAAFSLHRALISFLVSASARRLVSPVGCEVRHNAAVAAVAVVARQ